jgi:hypothetical protein
VGREAWPRPDYRLGRFVMLCVPCCIVFDIREAWLIGRPRMVQTAVRSVAHDPSRPVATALGAAQASSDTRFTR